MSTTDPAGPVLCALDFSDGSEAALVLAADLAERFHTSLLLLHADPLFFASPSSFDLEGPDGMLRERMRAFAEAALGSAEAVDVVDPEGVIRHSEYAGDAIVRQAEEVGARLVVVGTHGRRGLGRLLSGSVAEEVVRQASCEVLVVPNSATRTAPHAEAPILVPVDFSTHMDAAVDRAVHLAGLYGAPLRLLHVIGPSLPLPTFYGDVIGPNLYDVPTLVEASDTHLRTVADGLEVDAGTETRVGAHHAEIVADAQEAAAGLIVMATHGNTGLDRVLLGSVTERTLRQAPCPVFVVRALEVE
ncbi:universal stress protein [Rubrivirga sp.]|uniref:universal stress protein n=1 Tax=Rubrivirga sp. TaxID=1885344 RepID=UPI003C775CA4